MSILNILLCLGVVNLISPAFGDINPVVRYYNPVAADSDLSDKLCPGALVWVNHWQVFIGSSHCLTYGTGSGYKSVVRAGGDTNGEKKNMIYNTMHYDLGVGLIFFQGAETPASSFPMTPLIMPGILQKHESDAINDLKTPITISRDTWGPHHEVTIFNRTGTDNNDMLFRFDEKLKSGECPEVPREIEWGPAMRPSRWSVPLIIGVFKSSKRSEENGVCKVTLRYASIIPAVDWIERTVEWFYEERSKFVNNGGTEAQYLAELEKTKKYRQ